MNVLAIDQGTSATKAIVVGPDGSALALQVSQGFDVVDALRRLRD